MVEGDWIAVRGSRGWNTGRLMGSRGMNNEGLFEEMNKQTQSRWGWAGKHRKKAKTNWVDEAERGRALGFKIER